MKTWKDVNGDETLALDWKIDSSSLVWEIGGFVGRWAGQIERKFNPTIHIFEPQIWAVNTMKTYFEDNPKIIIHPYGLWTHYTNLTIWEHDTDGASVVRNEGRTSGVGEFRDIYYEMPPFIDLCLMNIEGAEYVLLPYLIGLGRMTRFRYFWCQFHPRAHAFDEEKTAHIYDGMSKTHHILWDYFPTAVAWEIRRG